MLIASLLGIHCDRGPGGRQRSRRFRAAKDARDREMSEAKVRKEFEESGRRAPPKKARAWDTNVITPGD